MSKHDDIIQHIYDLKVGTKISVRTIANDLSVSEGTAYRAIKECENLGIVSTVPRVGTVRIDKIEKRNIESLVYAEVVNIIDGSVLSGREGLYKTLNRLIIGAMTEDEMEKYIEPGNLLIVGNREEAQKRALNNECAVLITGGFGCSDEIKSLANKNELPVISTPYDTFTTATMINKAISENLIKKDIILVEDIMNTDVSVVKTYNTVSEVREIMKKTEHTKFPVVDENNRLVGIISVRHMNTDIDESETVNKILIKEPVTVTPKTSVAYASHITVWEGIELIPVVEGRRLVGVVTVKDIIKALQYVNRQPQVGETMDDIMLKNFTFVKIENGIKFRGRIMPEMLNTIGIGSWSTLTHIISTMGMIGLGQSNHLNVAMDSFTVFYIKPVQVDTMVSVLVNIIDSGRNFSKVEVEMISEDDKELIAKALLSAKVIKSK